MNLHEIEREAMHLTADERAKLAQELLLSLESSAEANSAADWMAEASRRARDLDEGLVQPVPAEEVRRKALALLR